MHPSDYNAWYDTARGRWIGEREYVVARGLLAPPPGASLLDVGCGTGWFSRRFARDGQPVTGIDPDEAAIRFAREKSVSPEKKSAGIHYVVGDGRALPFTDNQFDSVVSIAALCFIDDERRALAELVRVCRRRFVIGWLNRNGLLFRKKGTAKSAGGYRGARWHTQRELDALLSGLPAENIAMRSAVFFPDANTISRIAEPLVPAALPFGSLLFVAGDKKILSGETS